jgi:putative membrane protein
VGTAPGPAKYSATDFLAAERNFLAWIRTGLALMGFGFVVARFALFLQEIRLAEPQLGARSYGVSIWFGTAMIALGVVVNIYASWRHVQLVRELNRGGTAFTKPSLGGLAVSLILAAVGLAMAVYLISV